MILKKINKLIREFKFKNTNLESLYSEFDNLSESLFSLVITIPKGRAIYRCRRNNPMKELYYFEKDISYRTDLKNIKSIGRANHPFSSKFYGSLTPINKHKSERNNLEGYDLSIFETSEMFRNDSEGIERFTIGKWILKEDLKAFVVIPDTDNKNLSDLNHELIEVYEKYKTELNLTDEQIEFTELIGKEFSKKVKNGESQQYGISSTFAEFLLEKKFNAIAYPTVQGMMKGFNIVMNPSIADSYLKLDLVVVADLYKVKKQIILNHVYISELKNDYPFHWDNVSNEIYADTETIIQQFNSNDIHSNDIITALINQLKKEA